MYFPHAPYRPSLLLPLTESGHHAASSALEGRRKSRTERARVCTVDDEVAGAVLEPDSHEFTLPCGLVHCGDARGYLDGESLVVDEPSRRAPEAGSGEHTSPQ